MKTLITIVKFARIETFVPILAKLYMQNKIYKYVYCYLFISKIPKIIVIEL